MGTVTSAILSTSDLSRVPYPDGTVLILVLVLLAAMITKDIAGGVHNGTGSMLARGLSIGVVPLMLAFAVIFGAQIWRLL